MSVPAIVSAAALAKGMRRTSFLPPAASGFQRSDDSVVELSSARETTFASLFGMAGIEASIVSIDFEASCRITICGLVSGCRVFCHSGCQSIITTAVMAIMRRHSSAIVRLRRGERLMARNDNDAARIRAAMPIQRLAGVGEK